MAEDETKRSEARSDTRAEDVGKKKGKFSWIELLRIVALPLATLVLGFWFNKSLNDRQARESDMRLYTEMMGRREQADSDLRKDMFKSILDTFMSKDPKLERNQQLRQEVLNLELLAYNFHESLDIAPLFKDVRSRIPDEEHRPFVELRGRLERVAREVIERQLTVVSDGGMVERGSADPMEINDLKAYLSFGAHTVPDPNIKPGEGVSRLCLSIDSTGGIPRYRQFKLEIIDYDPHSHEAQVRLYVSQVLNQAECQQPDLDLALKQEIDTNFWVGLFDFPMIDNTRLTDDERCAVSLAALTPDIITMALAYFPGSRASLKDKPYYDEVIRKLVGDRQSPGSGKHELPGGAP